MHVCVSVCPRLVLPSRGRQAFWRPVFVTFAAFFTGPSNWRALCAANFRGDFLFVRDWFLSFSLSSLLTGPFRAKHVFSEGRLPFGTGGISLIITRPWPWIARWPCQRCKCVWGGATSGPPHTHTPRAWIQLWSETEEKTKKRHWGEMEEPW